MFQSTLDSGLLEEDRLSQNKENWLNILKSSAIGLVYSTANNNGKFLNPKFAYKVINLIFKQLPEFLNVQSNIQLAKSLLYLKLMGLIQTYD